MTDTNIFYETGDIQFSTCQTIVVPVNCEGTMDEGRCVVMHDAPSFLFITDINRFIFFKLR